MWSDIISSGSPFLQYQCLKKRSANFSAVSNVVIGIILMSDLSLLVNVTRLLYPSSRGNGPTKSIATELQQLSGMVLHLFSFPLPYYMQTRQTAFCPLSPLPSIRATVLITIRSHVCDPISSPHAMYNIYLVLRCDLTHLHVQYASQSY